MEVIVQPDARSASAVAARVVGGLVRIKPDAVLGLATGSTPVPLYRELIRMHVAGKGRADHFIGRKAEQPAGRGGHVCDLSVLDYADVLPGSFDQDMAFFLVLLGKDIFSIPLDLEFLKFDQPLVQLHQLFLL